MICVVCVCANILDFFGADAKQCIVLRNACASKIDDPYTMPHVIRCGAHNYYVAAVLGAEWEWRLLSGIANRDARLPGTQLRLRS